MRRIYFLLPDVASAKRVVSELLLKHIEERHIHIIAREHTPLEDLPEAKLAQSSDLVPAIERGIAAGGLCGAIAGLLAVTFPPAGLVFGGGALLGLVLFGAGFGAWMSGMVGAGLPNSHIEKYEKAVSAGALLMLIDVPRDRVEEIEDVVKQNHPEAKLEGVDPDIPLFP
ncbi:MAG: DUF1269 domain-containing protein [Burkholderiaceae bacterium]